MSVSIKTTGKLGRQINCVLPAGEVQTSFDKRLLKIGKRLRIDGFRPGKVPLAVVRERHGTHAFRELISEIIEDTYRKTISEHQLHPVGQPKIDNIKAQPGNDLEFSASIEVWPEFEPQLLDGVTIEKLIAQVKDDDVDDMVMQLRRSQAEWKVVERPVEKGDRVKVKFDKEKYAHAFAAQDNELTVVVGDLQVIEDFDMQLIGADLGKKTKVKVQFPDDCPENKLAGKKKSFKVIVQQIEECLLPNLDQTFFDKYEIHEGGLEQLKKTLREGMEYQLKNKLKSNLKEAVISALIEKNPIDLPQVLVEEEITLMKKQMAEQLKLSDDKLKELKDDLFLERAQRHVHFFLIMNRVAEQKQLQISEQAFEAKIDEVASAYEDPEAVKPHYRNDPNMRMSLRAMLLEEEVIQQALKSAMVNEKPGCFRDVIR